jgi:predicted NAD/FAD-binding protein
MFDSTPQGGAPESGAPEPGAGRQRIAVVGAGIAGLSAAWLLSQRHDVALYEASAELGGHCRTVDVNLEPGGPQVPVDTGFMVFNERNYPRLAALFRYLGIETQPSDMSFAVSARDGGFEYAGGKRLGGLLAQPANATRATFWRMAIDILRFNRAFVAGPVPAGLALGQLLERGGYSRAFRDLHIVPMAAAIWSGTAGQILDMPCETLIRFFRNHGLLQISGRPRWRSVAGGSRSYVRRLATVVSGRIHRGARVTAVIRDSAGVEVALAGGKRERFDQCVVAAHADQALSLIARPSETERRTLGAFRYQRNTAVLHRDPRLMPRRRAAWASWNVIVGDREAPVFVTYWLNRLQRLDPSRPVFLSLNPSREPAPSAVIARFAFDHPQLDGAAIAAQARLPELQGMARTWFCGSYFGFGFHEDALASGLAVARAFGLVPPWESAPGFDAPASRVSIAA